MLSNSLVFVLAVFVVAALVWNSYPPLRSALRGWSTVIEGLCATALYYFGAFGDAIQDAQRAGYVPEQLAAYVPAIMLAWLILKRWQTTTPLGHKG